MADREEELKGSPLVTVKSRTIEVWMGADYSIRQPPNIGALKQMLQAIIDDLPADDGVEIAEVFCSGDTIQVTLKTGIPH